MHQPSSIMSALVFRFRESVINITLRLSKSAIIKLINLYIYDFTKYLNQIL